MGAGVSMAGKPDATTIPSALTRLEGIDREALQEEFRRAYGIETPPKLSQHHLRLAIAHRAQETAFRPLSPEVRKLLLTGQPTAAPRATPGTILIRTWQGMEHTVVVHPDRVEYAGERFRSLTEVALRITGQKRSGPAFFGLRRHG